MLKFKYVKTFRRLLNTKQNELPSKLNNSLVQQKPNITFAFSKD